MTAVLTTLLGFNLTDGAYPGGLVADANGDLFGTTQQSGSGGLMAGSVFELVNNHGTYTLNTLVNFNFNDSSSGVFPSGLIADANADLFGTTPTTYTTINNVTTFHNGTVFELVNNNGTYTFNTPFTFSNGVSPHAGLIVDGSGDLFGAAYVPNNNGMVFELVNNNGTYTLNTLFNFNGSNVSKPNGGLLTDANGDLFGTSQQDGSNNDGTVFELVKNNGTYTLNTLINFNGGNGEDPSASLMPTPMATCSAPHAGVDQTTSARFSSSLRITAPIPSILWLISTVLTEKSQRPVWLPTPTATCSAPHKMVDQTSVLYQEVDQTTWARFLRSQTVASPLCR
jgi:hypothetical protein